MDVGFIGLGAMGGRMAANLLRGGHRLWVHDIAPAAVEAAVALGAVGCRCPRDASVGREAVLLSLPTPTVVETVVLGPDGVMSADPIPAQLIDMSTSSPSLTRRLATIAASKGCEMLDAPVSGRPEGAADATLGIMVGGSVEGFERALPLLRLLGTGIHHTGGVGSGHIVKLVNNAITGSATAAIAEALMMGAMAGVDPKTMYDVLSVCSANSRSLQNVLPRVLRGDYEPGFTVNLMHKDLDLAAQLGHEVGVPMPSVNLAKQTFQLARVLGLGQKDSSAIALMLELLMKRDMRKEVTEQ